MDAAPAPTKEPHHPAGRDHWAGRDADELAPPPEQASPALALQRANPKLAAKAKLSFASPFAVILLICS